jgi:hypothetical protein
VVHEFWFERGPLRHVAGWATVCGVLFSLPSAREFRWGVVANIVEVGGREFGHDFSFVGEDGVERFNVCDIDSIR